MDVNQSDFVVKGGAQLTLPSSVTSYAGAAARPNLLQAEGTGSLLNLSSLTSFAAGTNYDTNVQATGGGVVNLSGVTTITTGSADFYADGAGSVLNLANRPWRR